MTVTLIDATAIPLDRGGVGRYVDGLISALEGSIVIVCQARDSAGFAERIPSARIIPLHHRFASPLFRLVWEQFKLPGVARRAGADVIHSPHYTIPLATSLPRVVTFHDATFFSDPSVHTFAKRHFFRFWLSLSVRLARSVIVPSRSTASELARYLGVPERRFTVAYHGVDREMFQPPSATAVAEASRELLASHAHWIGFLGTLEPRKNLPALITAYFRLARRLSDEGRDVPVLALAGGRGWGEQLELEPDGAPDAARVEELGFVPIELLPAFLGGAQLVAYPSLGEGFGLPVLEAMACGAPVLTTRLLALPEVGGDAVAYSEPDEESLAEQMYLLLTDADRLREMSTAGITRAAAFTWDACARIHEAVYAKAVTDG